MFYFIFYAITIRYHYNISIIWLSPRKSWNDFLMKFKAHWISSYLIKRLDNHIRLHQVAMKLQLTADNPAVKSRKTAFWGAIILLQHPSPLFLRIFLFHHKQHHFRILLLHGVCHLTSYIPLRTCQWRWLAQTIHVYCFSCYLYR